MGIQKQAYMVRGNRIACINYQGCPICYGCRACDTRDPECIECIAEDKEISRNFNVCKTDIHEAWKINRLITKTKLEYNNIDFKSKGE